VRVAVTLAALTRSASEESPVVASRDRASDLFSEDLPGSALIPRRTNFSKAFFIYIYISKLRQQRIAVLRDSLPYCNGEEIIT
jgi:hypothetical protein